MTWFSGHSVTNRFLMAWGERAQIQAFPRRTPQAGVEALVRRVVDVLAFVQEKTRPGCSLFPLAKEEVARSRYAELCQISGRDLAVKASRARWAK